MWNIQKSTALTPCDLHLKQQAIWSLWRSHFGGRGSEDEVEKQALSHEHYQPIPTRQTQGPLPSYSRQASASAQWEWGVLQALQLCLFITWVWRKISHSNAFYTSPPAYPLCPELFLPSFGTPEVKSVSCQVVINCYLNGQALVN